MNPNTETGDLLPDGQVKSRVMRFDPTVTSGNILTAATAILAVGVGWGVLTARMDASERALMAQRQEINQMVADVREAMKEQRGEMRELQKSVNGITTDTALIRGRLAGSGESSNRVGKP